MSASVGFGFSASNAVVAMTKPGVQKPHISASQSMKACCTGVSWPSLREALDGGDLVALRVDGQLHAGVGRLAVDQHGARAAGGAVADFLRAGEGTVIAQRVEQGHARLELEIFFLAVDRERDRNGAGTLRAGADRLVDLIGDRADLHRGDGDRAGAESFQEGAAIDRREGGFGAHGR